MKIYNPFYRALFSIKIVVLTIFLIINSGCSKDDEPEKEDIVKSSEKELLSFSFLAENNSALATDVAGNINATAKTILINLASDTPLITLTPTFSISQKAGIDNEGAQDFTNPVTYTVTAEDGSVNSYTVTALSNSSAKQITSFVFLLTNNPIDINVVATIDEENKTITAAMPPGTDLSGLLPEVKLSELATLDLDTAQNFIEPLEYTVTAEDGSIATYTVTITTLLTQRQILQAILNANSQNTLGWDIDATANLGDLDGVTLNAEDEIIELILIDKTISTLPSEIGQLTNLTSLLLNGNQFTSLPLEIGLLTNLTELNLRANELTSLPFEIGQLINLTDLSLRDNQLTSLAPEIGQLTNLTSLDLIFNQLTSLPPEIGQLTNLNGLYLNSNQLVLLPPEIGQLTNLTSLILDGNQLTSLAPEIGQLTNLTSLDLDDNQLTSLPAEIGQLINLTGLELRSNQLTVLPSEIGQLTNLTKLILINNQLTSLPPEIGQLANLTRLELIRNQLTSLPPEIGQLTNLTELILNNNQLMSLPPEIGQLTNLTELRLRGNQLTTLPDEIGQLTNLTILDLRSNPPFKMLAVICDLQTSNGGILTILSDAGAECN